MKKIFTLLIGIVFITTIRCAKDDQPLADDPTNQAMKRVTIFLRYVEINGEDHLSMFDSNGQIAIDNLVTDVRPGTKVIWKLERCSRIKKIEEITWSDSGNGREILKNDPVKRLLCKGFKLKVPPAVELKRDSIKYDIEFIPQGKDKSVTIDPYIRIN